ncbi:N-acetylmuramoyl-L-alanine amidase [Paenibacillus spongiae]|uniref:N-acetylmuramoyl-L-alanine amidase n=1 Tax=Paenibacillus spongiae TaxID=2909671 RepID=A0ABY5SDR9_9BACL|nr:N-acetylmuramoyl-L-alanine amidase [Paenibacillus spongiae]UVI32102.1 N-acetylmuramoyl-L-alanine amidase [Paenibacillus spongiae]
MGKFKEKYQITPKYLSKPSKRRSGIKMTKVRFIVAHDTGNKNSTAIGNIGYYQNSRNDMSASAHIFLDDKGIWECIPALTGTPEKAWHVLYEKPNDNAMYGYEANNCAIAVEYCYGDNINANEAYKRYVWVLAYICFKFGLNPSKDIVGHHILDPQRKSDPKSGLAHSGRTYEQLLIDVVKEYEDCTKEEEDEMDKITVMVNGKRMENGLLDSRAGITYVPVRAVSEALGARVQWDSKTNTVRIEKR